MLNAIEISEFTHKKYKDHLSTTYIHLYVQIKIFKYKIYNVVSKTKRKQLNHGVAKLQQTQLNFRIISRYIKLTLVMVVPMMKIIVKVEGNSKTNKKFL